MIIWKAYNKEILKISRYLVKRKDGKVHIETYNGTGFAYNNNVIVGYSEINKTNLITVEESGVIALNISKVNNKITIQERAFFIAGFQEAIKYLNKLK